MASKPKQPETNLDLEAGATRRLYPSMTDNLELRWAFIRKVYTILNVQLLITAAIAAAVVLTRPVAFLYSYAGLGVFIADTVLAIIVVIALFIYRNKYPVNFILMGIFTVLNGLSIGMSCVVTQDKVVLEAVGITVVVFISLTLYTFWAARRGYDFSFLGPFLFAASIVLLGFILIQIFNSVGKISHMILIIIVLVGCIIFCAYIVYYMDLMIKRHEYDDYMVAAVSSCMPA